MAKRRSFVPKDENMQLAFEEILNSENYIVITRAPGEHEGVVGTMSTIRHDTDPIQTLRELEYFAYLFEPRAKHQQQMKDILKDNNIKGL